MGRPVVHFEIIGSDPAGLRGYYGRLFGWRFQVGDAATATVSRPGEYGFADPETAGAAGARWRATAAWHGTTACTPSGRICWRWRATGRGRG
ncbi:MULTISPECIES: hypothetical protein [Actinomadura]|uniref:hypothetical protein n=1 Tax=Actinomadura TaxID=1988 RepID=UPI002623117D|nr:hypothetical protein [Actinomadura geliboluensis]